MIVEIEIPEGAEPQYRAAARQIREWARGDQRADAARAVADALIEQIPPLVWAGTTVHTTLTVVSDGGVTMAVEERCER